MTRTIYLNLALLSILILSVLISASCKSGSGPVLEGDPPWHIPLLKDLKVDANATDWPDSYHPLRILSDIYGEVPDSSDLSASFRLAWNEDGLFILAVVRDDIVYEDPTRFWNGDGLEIFVSPYKGSFDIVQISVRPSYDMKDSLCDVVHYDHRRSDTLRSIIPGSTFHSKKSRGQYLLEGKVPIEMLGIKSVAGTEMAVQIYINDSDEKGDSMNHSLPWYPARESYRNPYAFHRIQFTESDLPEIKPEIRAYISDEETLHLKVLSDQSENKYDFRILSDNYNRKFNLTPYNAGLYIYNSELPLRKFLPGRGTLQFLHQDSLFSSINLCMAHRVYQETIKPNRFEDEIRIFEILDHYQAPPDSAILFTGSSTIRKWYDIELHFPGLSVINRGFGGSTINDLNYYIDRIVIPYKPSVIVVYEGDNDIARGVTPTEFIEECRKFIISCSDKIPDAEIYFMSIKPSPSRMRNWEDMAKANRLLNDLADQHHNVHFIDITKGLLSEEGTPKKDIFESDMLHLNKKGYEILAEDLRKFLYK